MATITPHDASPFRQLINRFEPDSKVLRTWNLTGGVSAQVTALEVQRADGTITRMVTRLHGPRDLASNPNIARDEFRMLHVLQANGIAAPTPIYLDESCDLFPTPILVMSYVDGETIVENDDPEPLVVRMAAQLAAIHRVPATTELSFLPQRGGSISPRPEHLDAALSEGRIRDALDTISHPTQANPSALLHGDYWPGNILWSNGEIAAVIDWEDAGVGDPLSDLGNARMETLFIFGPEAMQSLTDHYLTQTTIDTTNLPYWDFIAALHPCGRMSEWGLDPDNKARMQERHGWFVEQVLSTIAQQ